MKKHLVPMLGISILSILLFVACGSGSAAVEADNAAAPAGGDSAGAAPVEDISTTQGTGFCANEFFPLRSDKTWKYTITSGDMVSDYAITYKDISDAAFTAVQTFPNLSSEVAWQCSEEGMLSSEYASMNFSSDADVQFETLEVTGVVLPPAEQMTIGKIWDMAYTVQVTINSGGTDIQADGVISISREVAAIESVSVPAGTYDKAYRVDNIGEMTIEIMGTKTSTPLMYSDWYVKGVGMVKSASSDANLPYEMVLTSFE